MWRIGMIKKSELEIYRTFKQEITKERIYHSTRGHIRRDCRVLRCAWCHRHGHEESQCVRTYVNVAVPRAADENTQLLMNEVEAEEASVGSVRLVKGASAKSPGIQRQPVAGAVGVPGTPLKPVNNNSAVHGRIEEAVTKTAPTSNVEPALSKPMKYANTGGSIGKRTREETTNDGTKNDAPSSEEPPEKAPGMRRSSIGPSPKIPPDKRLVEKAQV
ncbi:hypothetical protein HPB51_010031 [Rhipicephalus microplus]|uniref:Uncharacterized protein n=1 Tax=Rhipicephalus microplus TaxID=6941 RepID=A0A9J6DTP2_RHIMP|nr:hypothetical protein HPB51_010031 [Rhipicephalus microplus]